MALFSRSKKEHPAVDSAQQPQNIDFEAIARDLQAESGASAFDSLLSAPINGAPVVASQTPFDVPQRRSKTPLLWAGLSLAILAALGFGSSWLVSRVVKPATTGAPVVAKPRAKVSIEVALTPQIKAQLKQLWEQGKAAKARGDYDQARRLWQEALKVRPNHPGFQESIDKLP